MNRQRLRVVKALGEAGVILSILSGGLLILWMLAAVSWMVGWAEAPARLAGPTVAMDDYGLPGVSLRVLHPTTLDPGSPADVVTILARANTPEAAQPLAVTLVLQDDALTFVGPDGLPAAGRVQAEPGYPDALPYPVRLAHSGTQLRGGLLLAHRVGVMPALLGPEGVVEVPELAFSVAIPGRVPAAVRGLLDGIGGTLIPYLVVGTVLVAVAWAAGRYVVERRQRTEAELLAAYHRLQEHIKLQRWTDARQAIESIRSIEPGYRDVPTLDTRVREEEAAIWRREHLFHQGVEAYRERNWRAAAHIFSVIEREDPYYRDVRFLHRTAMLYADLRSRDRSRRVAAARQLGEVGDLVEWAPLVEALGDLSEQVADAAEQAFQRVGPEAFDVLLDALRSPIEAVSTRSLRILKGYGQAVRERLLAALRSSDPAITAPVARLLADLGARRELAEALLWATDPHLEGIVAALVNEGVVASAVLIDALLKASPERLPVVLRAVGALKARTDITRQIDKAYRAARNRDDRERIEQAMEVDAAPYAEPRGEPPAEHVTEAAAGEQPANVLLEEPPAEAEDAAEHGTEKGRWLRLFDRRSS